MTKTAALLLGLFAAALVVGPDGPDAVAQTPRAGAGVAHIGVAVHDVERSAQAYADLAGIDAPPIELSDHGDGVGTVKRARLRLSNVSIELLQPTEVATPLGDFLAQRGQGVHHLALSMSQAGSDGLVDHLGLALHQDRSGTADIPAPVSEPRLAFPTCITHLGIVVRDIAVARRSLAEAIGVEATPIAQFEEARGQAKYTVFNLGNVSVELLQQAGGGTGSYADFLEAHGPRAHHLGVHLRRENESFSMQEQIVWLEQRDGLMAVDAGGFAYVDLRPRLGLYIEALPPAVNERVYPHPHPAP